ncbi:MAG: hypothetical protein J6T94_08445 [Bacteroidaceae bacterium]|nr:hypothetical protein [Bacteroidaceae bacterium]
MRNSLLRQGITHARLFAGATFMTLGVAVGLLSCDDDLLTGTPDWLGTSIYEELESRGCFKTTLALINDEELSETNYPEMLRRTGSMTLFVATDSVWTVYLAKRGVSEVGQLPRAEKKNLLKAAMVNNAYLIELLSNTPGNPPGEGCCMRRVSRVDITDSIPVVEKSSYPALNPNRLDNQGNVIDYWAAVRNRESIKIYKDNSAAPMVHFLPDFMRKNNMTSEDWMILTNGVESDVKETSYINGKKVIERDITCQNGYIHVLADVPEQLDNMAEIVNTRPQFSIFSSLLERFSYPQFLTLQSVNGQTDSLFVKRYFNNGGQGHGLSRVDETNRTVSGVLNFDPGWNQYVLNTSNINMNYQQDAAALFVPCDDAMLLYLSPSGEGSAIGKKYGCDWDNVPDDVVLPFVNNCMKSSFISTTPSKFENLRNTASEPMGVKVSDVDSCFMACNGVVYQLKRPFVAPEHQSVLFPAMLRADEDLSVIYKAITDSRYSDRSAVTPNWTINEYQAYLNSMACTYSFLAPTDNAFANYIDPYSIYEGIPMGYRFYLDPSNAIYPVMAKAFKAEKHSDGTYHITDQAVSGTSTVTLGLVNNRLQDLLDNIIVVHGQKGAKPFHAGQTIYLNKAGSPIEVQFNGDEVTGIAGSQAMNEGRFITIAPNNVTDLTAKGNGMSYVVGEIPMTTLTSPYKVLTDSLNHLEYAAFTQLLLGCSFVGDRVGNYRTIDKAFSLLGNYNYTLYVPSSDKIDELVNSGKLPSWDLYDEWDGYAVVMTDYADSHPGTYTDEQLDSIAMLADSCKNVIQNTIENFIRYHIQDGSVYIGGVDTVAVYETAAIDTALNRFQRVRVRNTAAGYTVTDNTGRTAHVVSGTNSNLPTRQYLFNKSNRYIYSSSYVVLQLIDNVLSYDDKQFLDVATFPVPTYPDDLSLSHRCRQRTKRKADIKNVLPQWKQKHDPQYQQNGHMAFTLN